MVMSILTVLCLAILRVYTGSGVDFIVYAGSGHSMEGSAVCEKWYSGCGLD